MGGGTKQPWWVIRAIRRPRRVGVWSSVPCERERGAFVGWGCLDRAPPLAGGGGEAARRPRGEWATRQQRGNGGDLAGREWVVGAARRPRWVGGTSRLPKGVMGAPAGW